MIAQQSNLSDRIHRAPKSSNTIDTFQMHLVCAVCGGWVKVKGTHWNRLIGATTPTKSYQFHEV